MRDILNLKLRVAGILALGALAAAPADAACNRKVFGLTADQRLVTFRECEAGMLEHIGGVTGLSGSDTALVGIDVRVQNGVLYGVGNAGGIYVLDTTNAQATLVSQLTVALDGTSFGVDFNPAADRLRIVSDTGQNLRHNVNAGGTTIADGSLNNGGVTALGVTAAAYTNNDLDGSTATTLFNLDTILDQVVIQSPPNNGSLVATGKLGVDAGSTAGLDIFTELRGGSAFRNRALAVITVDGVSGLYAVELLTGKVKSRGAFESPMLDLAFGLDRRRDQ